MNKEKKQIVVLVSLVAVVGAVGAFQFMNKGPSADVVAKVDGPAVEDASVSPPTIPLLDPSIFLLALEDRDPFVPQAIMIDPSIDPRRTPPIVRPTPQDTGNDPPRPLDPGWDPRGTGIEPGPPLRVLSLRGVILGPKPLAVFEGADGRQTLVAEGGKLSNGAVVLSIAEGKVILKQNGRIRTMEFEEAYS